MNNHPGTVRRYVEGDDPFVTKGSGIEFYGQPDKKAVVFLRPYVPSPERTSGSISVLPDDWPGAGTVAHIHYDRAH